MIRALGSCVLAHLAAPFALFAQAEAGQGVPLRPYVHVWAAYGIAWLLVLLWAWRISRMAKRSAATASGSRRKLGDSAR